VRSFIQLRERFLNLITWFLDTSFVQIEKPNFDSCGPPLAGKLD
jgi:hypothetical protein